MILFYFAQINDDDDDDDDDDDVPATVAFIINNAINLDLSDKVDPV